jgi:hypothetical protein
MSTSSGNVCEMVRSVTATLAMGALKPETVMVDGYGAAGAPVEAPEPVPGIVIRVGFENVCALAPLGISRNAKAPRHTTSRVTQHRVMMTTLLL